MIDYRHRRWARRRARRWMAWAHVPRHAYALAGHVLPNVLGHENCWMVHDRDGDRYFIEGTDIYADSMSHPSALPSDGDVVVAWVVAREGQEKWAVRVFRGAYKGRSAAMRGGLPAGVLF